ncbi:MAG: hypothetical protein KGO02_23615 [Alphaproteobacteria bacterium]|nr:hypothetical protein [Alphaproteobacteria bacterium]
MRDHFRVAHHALVSIGEGEGDRLDPKSSYEREYLGHYVAVVTRLLSESRPDEAERIAQIISDAVDGVIHSAARRGSLRQTDLQSELVSVIVHYVAGRAGQKSV